MSKKSTGSRKLGWIVAVIWIAAAALAGGLLWMTQSSFAAPAARNELAAQVMPEITVLPTNTHLPTASPTLVLPTATLPPIPTATPAPTERPKAEITPIVFPTVVPTSDALWEGPITIGYSVEGRPLEVYRFGRGERAYLVIAGIHGGYEINTIQLADQLIGYFTRKPDAIPADATLYILRSMNPDGEALPHKKEGRSNANLVDLNRSFPVGWSDTWSRDGCWDLLELNAGAYPASEPETIALMAFVLEHPVIAVVSYHAAAPGFYPAGEPADPASVDLAEYLSASSGYPYPAFYTGCYMTGSLVDWTLSTGAAGVDVELSTHWDTEFNVNLPLVLSLLRWEPPQEE